MELEEIGVFAIDKSRVDHFFPHLARGTAYAVQGVSLANDMAIKGLDERPRRWRRPDVKLERIDYPQWQALPAGTQAGPPNGCFLPVPI